MIRQRTVWPPAQKKPSEVADATIWYREGASHASFPTSAQGSALLHSLLHCPPHFGYQAANLAGPYGRELACYIPDELTWKQLNYGQCEGQVEIDGNEWGLYWTAPDVFAVQLHTGEIDLERALRFVH